MKNFFIYVLILIALIQIIKITGTYYRMQELQSLINYEVDK